MKTLVLGATGFIGGHIAAAALAQGWAVRGLRRNPTSTGHLGNEPIEWMGGNLHDADSLDRAMEGIEVVFHAAAFYPRRAKPGEAQKHMEYARREIDNVLSAATRAGVKRFVYTSTLTTIGHPQPSETRLADERDIYKPGDQPKSSYAEAKSLMENAVLAAAQNRFPAVVLNPTAVFGPGDVHLTLGSLLITAAKGRAICWLPVTINAVDVRDVATAHIQAAVVGRIGERYIIGGNNLSAREAITIANRVAGKAPPRFEIPLAAIDVLVRIGDALPFLPLPSNHLRGVRGWQGYNTEKARRELGLRARPFEDTVRDALTWFRENRML